MSKYRLNPPADLSFTAGDLAAFNADLFRIVFAASRHVLPWGVLREYGPVIGQRWDPHPDPTADHPGCGVLYTATTIQCALAEVFQGTRCVDVTAETPTLLTWRPTRTLQLLDLEHSRWLIRNGAAGALPHGRSEVCHRWAAAIHAANPDLDGLRVPSTMYGTNIVLFEHAADAFPPAPRAERALAEPTMLSLIQQETSQIGYSLIATP